MSDIALCPNCGGQKTISKPPYIAGDVNSWAASGTPTYPCPTCDGRGWIRVSSVTQDDFDNVKFVALSSMETAENLMDECAERADRIKELEYQIKLRDTKTDELEQCRNNQRESITGFIVRTNELVDYVNELEADKTKLRGIIDVLNNRIKYSYNRALDVFEEKELEIKELEHRASVAEDRLRVVKAMRDELLEDWEKKRGDVARLQTIVYELESDITCFKSAVKGFRAVVGEKDLRIADMESQRDMVRKMRNRREEELLEIIDDLTTENEQLETYHARVRDTHQAREAEFQETCERYEIDLELLDEILKIVNPLIKSGAYARKEAEKLLVRKMYGLCQTVVQYRRKHNIVG